jgi:PKD repeat protein
MKNLFQYSLIALFISISSLVIAQDHFPVDDTVCVFQGEDFSFDLTLNDINPAGQIILQDPTGCFQVNGNFLTWTAGNPDCPCGDYLLRYFYEMAPQNTGNIFVTIKCQVEKPECFLTNLAEVPQDLGVDLCLYSCENSSSTYFVPHISGNTYIWTPSGATSYTTNAIGNEIYILWGPSGAGSLSLSINNGGSSTLLNFCVEILESPIADFSMLEDCVCLNGPISFINNSLGANTYLWDFGDGNTSINPNPTHTYDVSGTYSVTLYAVKNNVDPEGNPLCCCTDSVSMDVTVDPLEGPDIYWISTLCPGDKSIYWTDATGCSLYDWTVLDENGSPISFTGDGTDTICVVWGAGPSGTIKLEVSGCDQAYCDKPSTAIVPIISATSPIDGADEVCIGTSTTYTLPKWPSVYYDWTVTGGTITPGQNGSNTVVIQWGSGPTGTIHVDYYSEFLGGRPDHQLSDCFGTADLSVSILPQFEIFGPNPPIACVNSVSGFSTTASPSSNYSWTITPYAPFTGDGTASINVTWSTGAGNYTVMAVTNSPADYCNDTMSMLITVIELEVPDSIVGPDEICPGETYTYLGYTSTPNTTLEWTIQGGSPSTYTGSPVSVSWNPTGPYSLSLAQMQADPPSCLSDTITFGITPKQINGPLHFPSLPACTNSQQVYGATPIQHTDATLEWKVTPPTAGSIVAGQGTSTATVQWNNDPGVVYLSYCVSLCDSVEAYIDTILLNAPQVPTIIQVDDLCPGGSTTLDASSGFNSYLWSGPVISSSEDITITTGGTYILTTLDANNCKSIVSFEVEELPGPAAIISTPDDKSLCLPASGQSVTIYAQTNPNYEFTWFCNGTLVQGPSIVPAFTHAGTNVDSSFTYCVQVEDLITGCMTKSNLLVVNQDTCSGSGGCSPQTYTLDIAASNPAPACNVVDFAVTSSANVTLSSWNFGDPANNSNTGTLANATHTYTTASYYTATVSGTVPNNNPPPTNCVVTKSVSVCIPLAADFSFVDSCLQVCFTDQSTFLPSNDITDWLWDFGDGNSSVNEDPCHTYSASGTYTVTLTVENANNCIATRQLTITVAGNPTPSININPDTVCVGDPVMFNATGTSIISWLWDFADGSTNGNQNTSHSYLSFGNYEVSLTVENSSGCSNTVTSNVYVYPNPAQDTIAYDSSLIICEGETLMLSGPVGPYTYLWNTGDITSFLLVGTAGDYSVKVTDSQGCMMETDPVTVVVIPTPEVEISGPSFICDDGCVTLKATNGFGYQFQWLDQSLAPIAAANSSTYDVCDFMTLPASFYVEITDANGCSAIAGPHSVDLATSPVFSVGIVGDTCEGSPNVLSVPILPDVRYSWSTGASGLTITAIQAGTYTVIGVDTITGCSHTESVVINPLPDLCILPTGCYEICNPDTICGPADLSAYQWNMNGAPIAGETGQCLIVTQSGSYSLTGTNSFNCSLTSDTLILEVIECTDCSMQDVTSIPLTTGECCYSLSYNNNLGNIFGLMMHTADANISPNLGSLDPGLTVYTIGSNYIGLVNSIPGNPLSSGVLSNYLEFCLDNITNTPQTVIFDWYNDSLDIVCSDTLLFDCPIDSDCIYIAHDTIYCIDDKVYYDLTICNPLTNTFAFEYIAIESFSPPGLVVTPSYLDLSASPLNPGMCQTYTLQLSGTDIANKDYCFNLIAHDDNPSINPDALCCSLDTTYCIQIPGCAPCDMVYIEEVIPINDSSCCYEIVLHNYFDPSVFDGIGISVISPNTNLTINNPFGSDWITSFYSPTTIQLMYSGGTGNIPLGSISLPDLCIETQDAPFQQIEISWMNGMDVICVDTLEVNCEPDCGYIVRDSIHCKEDVAWFFEGVIKNTSDFVMDQIQIEFLDPGMNIYNQTIATGSLPPGSLFGPFFLPFGAPALVGQTICIRISLHELGHNDQHSNCCSFIYCFTVPDCGQGMPCVCDSKFEMLVEEGFSCSFTSGFTGTFMPKGALQDCDEVIWSWDDGSADESTIGSASIMHTFPAPGEYEVCMRVYRFDDNGKVCKARFCKEVVVKQGIPILFPNPAHSSINMLWNSGREGNAKIKLYSLQNRMVRQWSQEMFTSELIYDLSLDGIIPGVYYIVTELEGEQWIKKIIVY